MKRNGCCVTITMESYTDIDKIKRALIPFSKFQQEWIPGSPDNPITVILTTDNIYETQPRNDLYGMTYSFSFVFDLLVSALNQQNGVIEMSMDYLTILGNLGHCKFEFSRKPVPKGEKPFKILAAEGGRGKDTDSDREATGRSTGGAAQYRITERLLPYTVSGCHAHRDNAEMQRLPRSQTAQRNHALSQSAVDAAGW